MKMNDHIFSVMLTFLLISILLFSIQGFSSDAAFQTIDGNVYYVSKEGSDENPGSVEAPWLTIQHAARNLTAGETVLIREGTYHESVYIGQGGCLGKPITFSAYPNEIIVIDGTGVTESQNGLIISRSYISLSGLEICNWEENAIWVEQAGYLEISDCEIHDICYGIGFADGSHHFECNRVIAHHFDLYGFDVSPSGGADCHHGTFNDCIAYTGRDRGQNVDGFALGHGTQHDFTFNRCQAYDVFDGFDVSARNTILNRCASYHCWNGGYKLWQDEVKLMNCLAYKNAVSNVELDWDGEPGTITLQNCTFADSGDYNIWLENAADSLRMVNCILAGGENIGLAFEQMNIENYQGDYNLFHHDSERAIVIGYEDEFSLDQLNEWQVYIGQDKHSIVSHTKSDIFISPAQSNYRLSETSLAVDQGTKLDAPAEDYEGKPRPQGRGYDIGAFEK
jgi:hypothetical protein